MAPKPRLLDLTRLMSRMGQGALTGIDRVELAWARELLDAPTPLHALLRSRAGYLILDRTGISALVRAAGAGELPDRADWLSWLRHGGNTAAARAETLARSLAVARLPRALLRRTLGRRFGAAGGLYLNLGHANLTPAGLRAIGQAGLTRLVLVHDAIPLDHPQWARTGTVKPFRRKLQAVSDHADLVVHLTDDSRQRTEAHMALLGRVPPGVTSGLGLDLAAPDPTTPLPERPFVIALGTIEPRKNLGLLLAAFGAMDPALRPLLLVLGRIGWESEQVIAALKRAMIEGWAEHRTSPSDSEVAALMLAPQALALAFPSRAEGFGLPPQEARARHLPVIASDLPVLRETLAAYPIYLGPEDVYSWMETVVNLVKGRPARTKGEAGGMIQHGRQSWARHVNRALAVLGQADPDPKAGGQR